MKEDEKNIEPLLEVIRDFHPSFLASPWTPPKIWKYPIINRLRRLCFGRYARYLINYDTREVAITSGYQGQYLLSQMGLKD